MEKNMNQIKVSIVQLATGKTVDVSLPDNVTVGRLLPELAKRLGIQEQTGGVTEYKLSYKQPNPPDAFEFQEQDMLTSKGVKPGSLLAFSHSFVAGLC